MNKNISVNFILPKNEEDQKALDDKINRFNREVYIRYINSLNCGYEEKLQIATAFLEQRTV